MLHESHFGAMTRIGMKVDVPLDLAAWYECYWLGWEANSIPFRVDWHCNVLCGINLDSLKANSPPYVEVLAAPVNGNINR